MASSLGDFFGGVLGASVTVTQERYFAIPTTGYTGTSTWHVPLSVVFPAGNGVASTTAFSTMLNPQATSAVVLPASFNSTRWIKANAGQAGFYRVLYPTTMLRALVTDLLANTSLLDRTHAEPRLGRGWLGPAAHHARSPPVFPRFPSTHPAAIDRAGVLNDAMDLARAGLLPATEAYNVLQLLMVETGTEGERQTGTHKNRTADRG